MVQQTAERQVIWSRPTAAHLGYRNVIQNQWLEIPAVVLQFHAPKVRVHVLQTPSVKGV